ncbi:MAG: endolysin [Comamonas sp.]|nr:endolysin [Comamonas sp.]
MADRVPQALRAMLVSMLTAIGAAGGSAYLGEQDRALARTQLTEYLQSVAADTSTSDAVKLAMVLGSYYESSYRHIGTPYIDRYGRGQPLTVCNGITGKEVVAGRYYTPADCYRLEKDRYLEAERFLPKSVPTYTAATVFQQAVALDFIHNKGSGAFSTSTYRRKWIAGDTVGACRENERWNKGTVNGVLTVLPGLKTRGNVNSDLCAHGL